MQMNFKETREIQYIKVSGFVEGRRNQSGFKAYSGNWSSILFFIENYRGILLESFNFMQWIVQRL